MIASFALSRGQRDAIFAVLSLIRGGQFVVTDGFSFWNDQRWLFGDPGWQPAGFEIDASFEITLSSDIDFEIEFRVLGQSNLRLIDLDIKRGFFEDTVGNEASLVEMGGEASSLIVGGYRLDK